MMSEAASVSSGKLSPRGHAAFSGIDADILLGGQDAPMTVMAMTIAPGLGAPAHISSEEDKVFIVTAGELLFLIGKARSRVAAGDRLFVARGEVHGFRAVAGPAEMTLISTPAKHDRCFAAMSELPQPHDPESVAGICRRFGQAIVGPIVNDP